jgi:uncharacterized protein (DUF488 family)
LITPTQINFNTLGNKATNKRDYIAALEAANVSLVVDVRETAWSYKPGFSKAPLKVGLGRAGIDYLHLKSAGNPSKNRKTARSVKECLSRYLRHLRAKPECLDELSVILNRASREGKNICLTCFERHPDECHRSIIVAELERRLAKLRPVHLSTQTAN